MHLPKFRVSSTQETNRYLAVVGYPIEPAAGTAPDSTYADRAVRELERGGFGNATMVELRVLLQSSRKTYASALTVRDWLIRSKLSIKHFDVFTVGVHARKSWILFQHALGDNYHVGSSRERPCSTIRIGGCCHPTGSGL
jgi:hypothetical protein